MSKLELFRITCNILFSALEDEKAKIKFSNNKINVQLNNNYIKKKTQKNGLNEEQFSEQLPELLKNISLLIADNKKMDEHNEKHDIVNEMFNNYPKVHTNFIMDLLVRPTRIEDIIWFVENIRLPKPNGNSSLNLVDLNILVRDSSVPNEEYDKLESLKVKCTLSDLNKLISELSNARDFLKSQIEGESHEQE